MKTAFCLCFDKLNMTEGCQPEPVEGGLPNRFHNLIVQQVSIIQLPWNWLRPHHCKCPQHHVFLYIALKH